MNFKQAILIAGIAFAVTSAKGQTTLPPGWLIPVLDTLPGMADTTKPSGFAADTLKKQRKDSITERKKSFVQRLIQSAGFNKAPKKDSGSIKKYTTGLKPGPGLTLPKFRFRDPLRINGGYINYNYDYRSNIDTPFADRNVSQHGATGQFNVTAFNAVPLNVSFFVRQTNSSLFANICDVRVDFNPSQYSQLIRNSWLQKLSNHSQRIKDSMLNVFKQFNLSELAKIKDRFSKPDFQQKLVECNEIIHVPAIANSIAGPEKADSVRKWAKNFMDTYQFLQGKESQYQRQLDSIQKEISDVIAKGKRIKETVQGKFNGGSTDEVFSILKKEGVKVSGIERHLLAIRRFSLGRSPLNYSELTGKNISLNGINFEYNSWYYIAFAAGMVDYRFRDFIVTRRNRQPQFMTMARVGVGRLENNYIIFSAYKGKKQSYLYQNTSNGSRAIDIYGISAEVKYRLNQNNYVVAEVAESASPSFTVYDNPKSANLFDWKNKTNKAYSIKLYSFLPVTRTRLEGFYRYTGAFFHSFDRFQSNSSQQYWYVKAEQYLWKRQLRINASLRSNEFSNPYIIQEYSSNMIFKTVQVTLRKRNWPVISAGYMPSSQLTKIDNQLIENRFHTLNIIGWHQYKLGTQKLATTVGYNRFYNTAADTGFIYFNAINFFLQHTIFFSRYTASIGGSYSSNSGFQLAVLEESFQFMLLKKINLSCGLKVNNYQQQVTKIGSWWRTSFQFMKTGWLQAQFDNGFIPTNDGRLVSNRMVNIGINKTF
ncbi:MAG: hypothetical protein ABI675_29745 [Chitinophagaceae bacterium]